MKRNDCARKNWRAGELSYALRATIRIAGDFHDFLNKWGDAPPKEEVEYAVGTIRSGIDFFFSMMFLYRILDTSRARRTFSWWNPKGNRSYFGVVICKNKKAHQETNVMF